jgi:hypothetical protein
MPKQAGHYYDASRSGTGYNREITPLIIPIMEFDLTTKRDRDALVKFFELEYEQVILIKGSPEYLIIRGGHSRANQNFRWDIMRRSFEIVAEWKGQKFQIPAPMIKVTHEEFFSSLQPDQQKEFIFFLGHLI